MLNVTLVGRHSVHTSLASSTRLSEHAAARRRRTIVRVARAHAAGAAPCRPLVATAELGGIALSGEIDMSDGPIRRRTETADELVVLPVDEFHVSF